MRQPTRQLSKNFTYKEFECPCCGKAVMDRAFIKKLQLLREMLGVPFSPVKGGGYRCTAYNGSDTGAHTEGKAIDLDIDRKHYYLVISTAFVLGFTGIGVKNKSGGYQLHLDTTNKIKGKRPRPWIWTY